LNWALLFSRRVFGRFVFTPRSWKNSTPASGPAVDAERFTAGEVAIGVGAAVGRIDRVGIYVDDGAFAQVGVGDSHVEIRRIPSHVPGLAGVGPNLVCAVLGAIFARLDDAIESTAC